VGSSGIRDACLLALRRPAQLADSAAASIAQAVSFNLSFFLFSVVCFIFGRSHFQIFFRISVRVGQCTTLLQNETMFNVFFVPRRFAPFTEAAFCGASRADWMTAERNFRSDGTAFFFRATEQHNRTHGCFPFCDCSAGDAGTFLGLVA